MLFGISDIDLMDKNKIKILDGIAGSGKSTASYSELSRLGSKFIMASFSNALRFAASDKFGCDTTTLCSAMFNNRPFPRSSFKELDPKYDTIIADEILLDGVENLNWIRENVGKCNIIALTDRRQMLSAESGSAALNVFDKLIKRKDVIYVEISETKRARNKKTKDIYDMLFNINSNMLFSVDDMVKMIGCDVINFSDIDYNDDNAYICHSNVIEHEVYKRFDLSTNRNNRLIPKNHISRERNVNVNKYPILDQMTATAKRVNSYLQVASTGSCTRFQGREVEVGKECYFIVEEGSIFTGREIYTVCTRCQDIDSLHIVKINIEHYKDPETINNLRTAYSVRLDIPNHDKKYKQVGVSDMAKIIKEYGVEGQHYKTDIITSGDNIIYSTITGGALGNIADVIELDDGVEVKFKKRARGRVTTIRSITKKDTTMHFDYMPKVYSILKTDIKPPRVINPKRCAKADFDKMCDIYSAFPTILHKCKMPKAGSLFTERDDNLLNFYLYKGDKVTKNSLITEDLYNLIGDAEYVFSTEYQIGCELGHYTYEQSRASKEKKKNINKNFLWGTLESKMYKSEYSVIDGKVEKVYVKYEQNNLELVACALFSSLSIIMLNAISSIKAKKFIVAVDGLYYNGDKDPVLPEWCDYRIEDKFLCRLLESDDDEKYHYIIKKSYDDPPTEKDIKREKEKERIKNKRANMTEEERAAARAKDAERKRLARAKKKAEQL